jgi:hypothetical protein
MDRWLLLGADGARKPATPWRALLTTALLLLFGTGVGLALAEMALRVGDFPSAERSGWRYNGSPKEANQLGFRGRAIEYDDSDFVVVLLGDSQVESPALKQVDQPERQLERHLGRARPHARIKVVSLGASGYGNDQELLALREYFLSRRADLVVVWETPANDVVNNMFPTHWPWNHTPKPVFWLHDGVLTGPKQPEGERVPRLHLTSYWQRFWPADPDGDWVSAQHGQAYRSQPALAGAVTHDWPEENRNGTTRGLLAERLDQEKSGYAFGLTPRSARFLSGLDLTHALLLAIRDEARQQGAEVLFFNQTDGVEGGAIATTFQTDDDVIRDLSGRRYHTSVAQFWENVTYMNRDLPSVHVQVTVADWAVGPYDRHLNVLANDQVLGDLVPRLLPLIDRRLATRH